MKRVIFSFALIFISTLSFAQINIGGAQELDFGIGVKYKSVSDEFVNETETYRGYIFSAYGKYVSFDEDNFFWVELDGDGGFLKGGQEQNFDSRLGHTASFLISSGYLWSISGQDRELNIYLGPSYKGRAQYSHIIHGFEGDGSVINLDTYLYIGKIAASAVLNYAPYRRGWELRWQLDLPLLAHYYKAAEGTNFTYVPNLISVNSSLRYLRDIGKNYKIGATSKVDYYNLKSDDPISYISASVFFTIIMEIN
jgi:hypothetical protein